jgi:Flp pilus assembly protein TadG
LRRDWQSDEGNALVEFVYLAVLLMIPLVYLMITVFMVQRAAFGTTEAARQAGRAYARADTTAQAQARGTAAAGLAMRDQGVSAPPGTRFVCVGTCLAPGSRVRVTVTSFVRLPVLGRVFGDSQRGGIRVQATHTEYVDRFTSTP